MDTIGSLLGDVGDAASSAANYVGNGLSSVGQDVYSALNNAGNYAAKTLTGDSTFADTQLGRLLGMTPSNASGSLMAGAAPLSSAGAGAVTSPQNFLPDVSNAGSIAGTSTAAAPISANSLMAGNYLSSAANPTGLSSPLQNLAQSTASGSSDSSSSLGKLAKALLGSGPSADGKPGTSADGKPGTSAANSLGILGSALSLYSALMNTTPAGATSAKQQAANAAQQSAHDASVNAGYMAALNAPAGSYYQQPMTAGQYQNYAFQTGNKGPLISYTAPQVTLPQITPAPTLAKGGMYADGGQVSDKDIQTLMDALASSDRAEAGDVAIAKGDAQGNPKPHFASGGANMAPMAAMAPFNNPAANAGGGSAGSAGGTWDMSNPLNPVLVPPGYSVGQYTTAPTHGEGSTTTQELLPPPDQYGNWQAGPNGQPISPDPSLSGGGLGSLLSALSDANSASDAAAFFAAKGGQYKPHYAIGGPVMSSAAPNMSMPAPTMSNNVLGGSPVAPPGPVNQNNMMNAAPSLPQNAVSPAMNNMPANRPMPQPMSPMQSAPPMGSASRPAMPMPPQMNMPLSRPSPVGSPSSLQMNMPMSGPTMNMPISSPTAMNNFGHFADGGSVAMPGSGSSSATSTIQNLIQLLQQAQTPQQQAVQLTSQQTPDTNMSQSMLDPKNYQQAAFNPYMTGRANNQAPFAKGGRYAGGGKTSENTDMMNPSAVMNGYPIQPAVTTPMASGRLYHGVGGGQDDTLDTGNAMLSPGEFVHRAEVVSALGDGNTDKGANILNQLGANILKDKAKSVNKSGGKNIRKAKKIENYLPKKAKI